MAACNDKERLLAALLDGELDGPDTDALEAHVLRCVACRDELERLRAMRHLLRSQGVRFSAPEGLKERIFAESRPSKRNIQIERLPRWLVPVAAASAASVAILLFLGRTPKEPSVEEEII